MTGRDFGPPTLFNQEETRRRRDAAIEQVDENAAPDWKECALEAVRELAREVRSITSDDVWQRLAEKWPDVTTHEPRAMGPVMQRAVKERILIPTREYVPSNRPESHGGPKRVYLCRQPGGPPPYAPPKGGDTHGRH